jgi:predicted heme/steroid binding protein
MKKISRSELALNDGKEGRSAYIAHEGKVYDVTECFLWKGGRHQAMHEAGRDLTQALSGAPHGADLLERAPIIGLLGDD